MYVEDYRRRAGITPETGTRIATAGGRAERAHLEPDPPEEPS